jgi:hypothetical protein
MNARLHRWWKTPVRLSPQQARVIGGVAMLILVFAATGLFLYEGWPRLVHVSAMALIGLANLALALGSILPEERGGKALRGAVVPLTVLMIVALVASLAVHLVSSDNFGPGGLVTSMLAGGVAVVAVSLLQKRR